MRIASVALALGVVGCGPAPTTARYASPSNGLLVTTQQTCPRGHDCDIVEVLDLHTEATSQDKGFDELRARATARGADAVIGAEFEHGDHGEPSHLSGVIVRYGSPVPPHVVIGEVDVPSDPNDKDKGMAQLSARASQLGGDQVIDVTFEHGDDGAQGHLRGKVIKFTR